LNQFWSAGEALIKNIRAYQRHKRRSSFSAKCLRKLARGRHFILSVITSSDIGIDAKFGPDVKLPHPNGVVIHDDAAIGAGCMIMQQVTIGQTAENSAPNIGTHVYIGAGAKVLGNVTVGDGAQIGANAVVLIDVPADCTAVGVPARVVPREK
jgi:serine O-acetyltransferase